MSKTKKPIPIYCLNSGVHHYQQITDYSITAHTLQQWVVPPPMPKVIRFLCIQCGNVIKVE